MSQFIRFSSLCVLSALGALACSSSESSNGNPGPAAPAAGGQLGMGQAGAPQAGTAGTGVAAAGAGGSTANAGAGGATVGEAGAAAGGASGSAGAPNAANFAWPDGKTAAVTLTYDDGLDAHLAHVIPLLDMHGFKGTFFVSSFPGVDHDWSLPNLTDALTPRHEAWAGAVQAGHEVAAHTVNHPCTLAVNPGQSPGFLLNVDYDAARISAELDESIGRLARLGVAEPLTFAFPCYSDRLGVGAGQGAMVEVLGMQLPQGQPFVSDVASRFLAARGSDEGIADPATVDLHSVPHVVAGPATDADVAPMLAELTGVVDMAIAQGAWVVFLMHGVAGDTLPTTCDNGLNYDPGTCVIDYLGTPTAVHDGLVQYLADNEAALWTASFKEVAGHVATTRGE